MIKLFDKNSQRIPILMWVSKLEDLEQTTLDQARNLSVLPIAFDHIALMPDAHQGYGMPIGGVMAVKDAVIPYAVGLDIGCGMHSVKTNISAREFAKDKLHFAMSRIVKAVPQGFNWHKKPQKGDVLDAMPDEVGIFQVERQNIKKQLGTLGGGNHFIEFQRDTDDKLWIMIHSGSRNIGKKVAEHFHKRAVKRCRAENIELPTSELSFFHSDSFDGEEYLKAMNWCLDFAKASRTQMMDTVLDIIQESPLTRLDIHHNYAALEEHYGEKVIIHRKGATCANAGLPGIIPGSMGSNSYITVGKGNAESFNSSAHGAGRRMGRNAARRSIKVEKVLREMDEMGILISASNKKELPEESPEAYKDIDAVMAQQSDLVEIRTVLKPIGVIKG